jgi:hypothetical protein
MLTEGASDLCVQVIRGALWSDDAGHLVVRPTVSNQHINGRRTGHVEVGSYGVEHREGALCGGMLLHYE